MNELDAVARARVWIESAERIVALTGAGISTDSGIPDFRGPQGVWTKNPSAEKLSTLEHYLAEPEVRKTSWQMRVASPAWTAQPDVGHLALLALEQRGKLHAPVTQNIDGLHLRAGHAATRVVEGHGTLHEVTRWGCGWRGPMRPGAQAHAARCRGVRSPARDRHQPAGLSGGECGAARPGGGRPRHHRQCAAFFMRS